MAVPNPAEVCTIVIDGVRYSTWETVMVQHRYMEAYPLFEISVSEPTQTPSPTTFTQYRFGVGALVQVYLANILAITGIITTRQSAADANRHGIQFIGKGKQWQMAKSSIAPPAGNFDNQTYMQIAQTICGQVGVGVAVAPDTAINGKPFPKCQAQPGEPSWDFLEKLAREKEIILGADEFGNLLLIGQGQPPPLQDVFQEGGPKRNIERINVIINNEHLFAHYFAAGQNYADGQSWGTFAAQIGNQLPGSDLLPSNLVVPAELPVDSGELQRRLAFERQIHEGTHITAIVVVPGWRRSNGGLWLVGRTYTVIAPDHFPNDPDGIQLAAKTVTFTQDEGGGTLTTLELVLPGLLNGTLTQPGLPSPATPPPSQGFFD